MLYLIKGTDEYRLEEYRKNLIKKIDDPMNVVVFDMLETPIEAAINEADSFSFFGDKKLIIVQNPWFLTGATKPRGASEQNPDELIHFLKRASEVENDIAIFAPYEKLDSRKKVTKELEKAAEILDASPLQAFQLKQILQNQNINITPDALEEILTRTNNVAIDAINEINKIKTAAPEITIKEVEDLVPRSLDQKVFDLSKHIMKRDLKSAINLVDDLIIQREEPIKLNAILINHFTMMLQIKALEQENQNDNQMAKILGKSPWQIGNARKDARALSPVALAQALNLLIETDYRFKTESDNEKVFKLTLIKLCAI
ncbi:MAG: DNA polymerase III subunit delta [Lactobacillales bacterium]|jgi:DNA polymerase-3 subunit delta|nr:DNA polymerase III subunit delta [Lactobacillales bacterium]